MGSYVRTMRDLVGSRRIFVPGVRALIPNGSGEILLQRRTDTSLWGLPSGAVEPGESAVEALKREVMEETSVTAIRVEPMALYSGPTQEFIYPNGDQVQCFAIAFVVREWEGRPQADGTEGSDVQFFPPGRLPQDLVRIHQETLDDYARFEGTFLVS
jgi:ADP-ribose pyrophosphatase YjhB (NUDIX family)